MTKDSDSLTIAILFVLVAVIAACLITLTIQRVCLTRYLEVMSQSHVLVSQVVYIPTWTLCLEEITSKFISQSFHFLYHLTFVLLSILLHIFRSTTESYKSNISVTSENRFTTFNFPFYLSISSNNFGKYL